MAAHSRVVTLNLGMQTVSVADFRPTSAGGLVLHNFRQTELLADPTADASRLAQLKIAVKENVDHLKLRGAKASYSIAAQSVFTRFVKLPPVEEDKIEQIVTFEAQQNVPFPINEVVWDHQLVSPPGEGKIEVALVAIKADMLEDINSAIEGAHLETHLVDVAPMALFNAFRYNYADLGGCSLLIDIGARTTNLIFIEGKKVFTRSLTVGGGTLTGAIAKDFGEDFAAAEQRKKSVGFVGLGGAYAEHPDPDVARLAKIIRNTMTRLHAEIARSISFYRTQQQGAQPVRVFLAGGGSSLPYMREFFNEKLGMPVEYFNPLRNVAVAGNLDVGEVGKAAHTLGETVGLALRSVSDCPMEFNLTPRSVERARKAARQRPYFVLAGLCVWLAVALGWFWFYKAAEVKKAELAKFQPKEQNLKSLEAKFKDVDKQIKTLRDTAAPLVQACDDRGYWVKILDDLNARLPKEFIWITVFDPGTINPDGSFTSAVGGNIAATASTSAGSEPATAGGAPNPQTGPATSTGKPVVGLRLHGFYLLNRAGPEVVDKFFQALSESPNFTNVKLALRAQPTDTAWAFDWEIRAELKNPISVSVETPPSK